jgi:hypothetical protein
MIGWRVNSASPNVCLTVDETSAVTSAIYVEIDGSKCAIRILSRA